MQKISCFTPTHNPKYISELYQSIKDQPFYEWVIIPQDCQIPDFKDDRIKIFPIPKAGDHFVGALKKYACSKCTGDILLELDHDDLLMPTAIEEVEKAFKDAEVGFVYSNTANFRNNFEKTERYGEAFGWKYRPVEYNEHQLEEHISFEPTPEAVSRIWYAPNHLRAWRKSVYDKIGGHNTGMRVLDDQELLCRTFIETKFKHIDKCLYLYRIDGNNTWLKYNKEIQNNVYRIYDQYIEKMGLKVDGRKLDLGGRFGKNKDYESVDLKDADINTDLNQKWPFEDNSVSVIRANDVFEHLKDPIFTMKECWRVLKPGGFLIGQVPSTDGRGAFQDPTHCSFWNENSFFYYTNKNWAKYIDTPVKFQAVRLYTTEKDQNQVCWVKFNLIKLDGNRPPGLINI